MSAVKDLWLRAQEPDAQLTMSEIKVLRNARRIDALTDINLQCRSKEFNAYLGDKKCTTN